MDSTWSPLECPLESRPIRTYAGHRRCQLHLNMMRVFASMQIRSPSGRRFGHRNINSCYVVMINCERSERTRTRTRATPMPYTLYEQNVHAYRIHEFPVPRPVITRPTDCCCNKYLMDA